MNPNLSDWDDDLFPEPEEVYQDLVRALKRKSGLLIIVKYISSISSSLLKSPFT
ncbi:hypothetical protein H6G86_29070 [Nostoc sp. FACHB-133]|nr:hypothetical protein [Nostoc sp. FACHB-133]